MATMSQDDHRFHYIIRPDPHGRCQVYCWCGWHSRPRWLEDVARADHAEHQREMALKI
jgi:hypothetical protein